MVHTSYYSVSTLFLQLEHHYEIFLISINKEFETGVGGNVRYPEPNPHLANTWHSTEQPYGGDLTTSLQSHIQLSHTRGHTSQPDSEEFIWNTLLRFQDPRNLHC